MQNLALFAWITVPIFATFLFVLFFAPFSHGCQVNGLLAKVRIVKCGTHVLLGLPLVEAVHVELPDEGTVPGMPEVLRQDNLLKGMHADNVNAVPRFIPADDVRE